MVHRGPREGDDRRAPPGAVRQGVGGGERSSASGAGAVGDDRVEEGGDVDTSTMMTRLEAAVEQQLLVAGAGPEVEAAGSAILAALGPAVRQMAFDLAEQAASEVAAYLPGHEVAVVLEDGEPALRVRSADDRASLAGEGLDARITLRLPPNLKELIEDAAESAGESVNTWLVKNLSSRTAARRSRAGRVMRGTIET